MTTQREIALYGNHPLYKAGFTGEECAHWDNMHKCAPFGMSKEEWYSEIIGVKKAHPNGLPYMPKEKLLKMDDMPLFKANKGIRVGSYSYGRGGNK